MEKIFEIHLDIISSLFISDGDCFVFEFEVVGTLGLLPACCRLLPLLLHALLGLNRSKVVPALALS